MSRVVKSPSSKDDCGGLPLPFVVRLVVFGVAWLPALVLLVFITPRFESLFANLQARAELPAMTEWVLWFATMNRAFVLAPCVVFVGLLLACDVYVAGLYRRPTGRLLYWVWFTTVVTAGIMAAGIIVAAVMIPVLKMSQAM